MRVSNVQVFNAHVICPSIPLAGPLQLSNGECVRGAEVRGSRRAVVYDCSALP